jgi:hypothetical protein
MSKGWMEPGGKSYGLGACFSSSLGLREYVGKTASANLSGAITHVRTYSVVKSRKLVVGSKVKAWLKARLFVSHHILGKEKANCVARRYNPENVHKSEKK